MLTIISVKTLSIFFISMTESSIFVMLKSLNENDYKIQ